MTSAKDTAEWLVFVIEQHLNGEDVIVKLDDLENGEFALIDADDGSVHLITVQSAEIAVAKEA